MIKPIDEIPKNQVEQRKSYRQQIREDIQEAIDKGIYKFEFAGDYNFKTLAGIAREEVRRISDKIVYNWSKNHPEYKERYEYWRISSWEIEKAIGIIKISSIKGETPEKRRVFCEIKPDMDSLIQEYAEKTCRAYEERQRKKQEELEAL